MRNLRILAALGLLTTAAAANAGVSSTWTLTSDYDYRGITQTDEDPALQASLDYAADNGWYVGAWASNVDFGPGVDVDYEVDLYTGFTGETEAGLGWDVGFVYYAYPDESDFNYPEIYGSLSYSWFKGKLWYSNDFGNTDESSIYLDANATVPLPANFSLLAHAGYSDGDAIDVLFGDSYMDYSVGVGYEIGNFSLSLKYVDTDIDDAETDRVIFTVATTFPWGD